MPPPTAESVAKLNAKNRLDDASGNKSHAGGRIGASTSDLHELLRALQAVRVGDFSVRLPGHQTGVIGRSPTPLTTSSPPISASPTNLSVSATVVGRDGKTRQRVKFGLSEWRLD